MSTSGKARTLVSRLLTAQKRIYGKLQPWQTRLVKLLPDESGRPLQCELHVAEITFQEGFGLLDESRVQTYEALSYCRVTQSMFEDDTLRADTSFRLFGCRGRLPPSATWHELSGS